MSESCKPMNAAWLAAVFLSLHYAAGRIKTDKLRASVRRSAELWGLNSTVQFASVFRHCDIMSPPLSLSISLHSLCHRSSLSSSTSLSVCMRAREKWQQFLLPAQGISVMTLLPAPLGLNFFLPSPLSSFVEEKIVELHRKWWYLNYTVPSNPPGSMNSIVHAT